MPKPRRLSRRGILESAANCTLRDRDNVYGSPEDNFQVVADFWTTLFGPLLKPGARIQAYHVALAEDLLKTARLMQTPDHEDGWVDKAGYSACGGEVATRHLPDEGAAESPLTAAIREAQKVAR